MDNSVHRNCVRSSNQSQAELFDGLTVAFGVEFQESIPTRLMASQEHGIFQIGQATLDCPNRAMQLVRDRGIAGICLATITRQKPQAAPQSDREGCD